LRGRSEYFAWKIGILLDSVGLFLGALAMFFSCILRLRVFRNVEFITTGIADFVLLSFLISK
jgi:hypothetical protein